MSQEENQGDCQHWLPGPAANANPRPVAFNASGYQQLDQRSQFREGSESYTSERIPGAKMLARRLKSGLLAVSLVCFGIIGSVRAFHKLDTATTAAASSSSASTLQDTIQSNTQNPTTDQSSGGFLTQQGENNFGTSGSSTAYTGSSAST